MNTTTIKNMASTLTEEQCQAFWPLVNSRNIISELYAVSKVTDIYENVTPDDLRELGRVIIGQFEDDSCEAVAQMREAFTSRTHTVQSLIRFRVGNFAEFDFIKKYLPKHTLQKLAWGAISAQINNNNH